MSATLFGQDLGKIGQVIGNGLAYWGSSLRLLLPQSMRDKLTVDSEELVVYVENGHIAVSENIHGAVKSLGGGEYSEALLDDDVVALIRRYSNKDRELILTVSDDVVLSKPVNFPAAVAENLNQTLFFEMDKHTPFPKSEIYFDTQIDKVTSGKVFARLFILHQSQIATILPQFEQQGVKFHRLCTTSEKNINLLPQPLRKQKSVIRPNMNWLLGLLVLGLLAVALAVPLYFKRAAAIELDQQISLLNPQADGELGLWEKRDETERVITEFLSAHPVAFSTVYEELSKRLPDTAWFNNLRYNNGRFTVRGEAQNAAALIAQINASHLFSGAKIISPIVKTKAGNKEVFSISFETVATGGTND